MRFILARNIERLLADGRAILLINITVILLLAWTASFWVNMAISSFLKPDSVIFSPKSAFIGKVGKPLTDYSIIVKNNIFNRSREAGRAVELSLKAAEPIIAPRTSLNIELLGTIITDDPTKNAAVIMDKASKVQTLYKVSDSVQNNAVIVRVDRLTVFIDNSGRMEKLSIDIKKGFPKASKKSSQKGASQASQSGSIRAVGEGQVVMDRAYLEKEMKDMSRLLVQVRAVPHKNPNGQIEGFRLFQIIKGSIYQKIGLKNQDVVKRVNGQPINSAEQGLALLTALKNESNFTIDLVRNKANKTLTVELQ